MKRFCFFILTLMLCAITSAQTKVILPKETPETFVQHEGYTVSFNDDARIPNYVSYRLRPEDITTEGISRSGEGFLPDPEIPGCPESRDYSRTGYDRGHMMPAADCKTDEVRMSESFYLSNVCPQNHTLNEKDWCDLEKQVRFWCKHYYKTDLFIVCGPLFTKDSPKTPSGITIPDAFWKVVCRYDERNHKWESAGFLFTNDGSAQPYALQETSVDRIETVTGMDFFSEIIDHLENPMEKNAGNWKF